MTLITVIEDPYRNAGPNRSTTSKAMKPATDRARGNPGHEAGNEHALPGYRGGGGHEEHR